MGLWDKIEADYKSRKGEKVEQTFEKKLANWQAQRDATASALNLIKTFDGASTDEIMLTSSEVLFYKVTSTGLIEERNGPGHYEGRSQGFSFPIASVGGRSIRYRVGASKGQFAQGTPRPTQIDIGTTYITNKRLLFEGSSQTRECSYDKLLGVQHSDAEGSTTLSISNRQKPTTIFYGPKLSGVFDFRLELALAHYRNNLTQLIDATQQQLESLDANKPTQPTL